MKILASSPITKGSKDWDFWYAYDGLYNTRDSTQGLKALTVIVERWDGLLCRSCLENKMDRPVTKLNQRINGHLERFLFASTGSHRRRRGGREEEGGQERGERRRKGTVNWQRVTWFLRDSTGWLYYRTSQFLNRWSPAKAGQVSRVSATCKQRALTMQGLRHKAGVNKKLPCFQAWGRWNRG